MTAFWPLLMVVFRPYGGTGGANRKELTGGCPYRMFEKL